MAVAVAEGAFLALRLLAYALACLASVARFEIFVEAVAVDVEAAADVVAVDVEAAADVETAADVVTSEYDHIL
jgi:hypothetical protein